MFPGSAGGKDVCVFPGSAGGKMFVCFPALPEEKVFVFFTAWPGCEEGVCMIDFVVGAIIVVIVGAALAYIVKSGKNGIKCVGCPDAKSCASGSHGGAAASGCGHDCGACSGCGRQAETKK